MNTAQVVIVGMPRFDGALLRVALEEVGISSTTIGTGPGALRAEDVAAFDLWLLDLDGVGPLATRLVRTLKERQPGTPIVAVGGALSAPLPVDAHLVERSSFSEIAATVQALLESPTAMSRNGD